MPDAARPVPRALSALLAELVDYAGLFPPAALPFDEAFANYLAYRGRAAAWMLGPFVAPLARLRDAADRARAADVDAPVPLSALASGGDVADDLQTIAAFHARHGDVARVAALELKLPETAWHGNVRPLLDRYDAASDAAGLAELTPFGELPLTDDALGALPALAAAVAERNAARTDRAPFGLKIRLGGATPADHPPVAPVARVVAAFARADVPFKATAGLHHPIRHHNQAAGADMHGFLNLFVAAVLAHDGGDADLAGHVLGETDPTAFRFDDDGLAWRDRRASLDAVRAARAGFVRSIGSCSFEEPVHDLQALGLL